MPSIRHFINLLEAKMMSAIVYHGSDHEIAQFRFNDLRHRTGTPNTLSFASSPDHARIYGQIIYKVKISGVFGDYLDAADCEKVFAWRWPKHRDMLVHRGATADELPASEQRLREEIAAGQYALWENVGLWRAFGWDGAWCFEPMWWVKDPAIRNAARNLIVGAGAQITIVDRIDNHPKPD